MSLFEQWQKGMILFRYALEAQLTGAKTMAFYEMENQWQRENIERERQAKYNLEDELNQYKKERPWHLGLIRQRDESIQSLIDQLTNAEHENERLQRQLEWARTVNGT